MEFDGDVFAEDDYGIVVDASSDILKLDRAAEVAIQARMASLSDVMKMWTSANSLAEKIRILQNAENRRIQEEQQAQQAEVQKAQAAANAQIQMKQLELDHEAAMNSENNETKIMIAQIQAESRMAGMSNPDNDGIVEPMSEEAKAKLREEIREFDIQIQQENKKLGIMQEKNDISRIAAHRKPTNK